MVAEPWAGRPFARSFSRLFGRHTEYANLESDSRPVKVRRLALLALVLLGAWVGTHAMVQILPEHGASWAEKGLLTLFGVLFGWISAGFWTGVMGAFVLLRGPGRGPLMRGLADEPVRPIEAGARTAIVMPICNEHVPTVFGGLSATIDSLMATGEAAQFDVYVLSDTNDPAIRVAEQGAWSDLANRLARAAGDGAPAPRVHYRWRTRRTKRKAGNVADFCRRWGGAYRYFVVMDADSVMTGECLTTLVRTMQAHPDAGIVQTAPKAVGHETFHARVQQFCARAYGPLFTAGMRFWQLGESHYWGHNAIIRMEPFLAHCGLAEVCGDGPLAGEILSHDFVEAALMRRAGWKVWVADEIDGSYEQVPPNLLAELGRDRRWAQGNLQNSRLVFEPGLHPVHRTVFVTGVFAYLSSPFWLAFLMLSTVLFATHSHVVPTYFTEPYQLYPSWPTANFKLMLTLFGLTAVLLLAPKVISLIAIIGRGNAKRYGGAGKLLLSALLEFLHSVLLAPVRMLFHTQFVLAALAGVNLAWKSPPRHDDATGWGEAVRRHALGSVLALTWIGVIIVSATAFQWWLSPVLAGLLLAIPLSAWTSRSGPGRWLAQRGIFVIPEELQPPPVLAEVERYAAAFKAMPGFVDAVCDPSAHADVVHAIPVRPPARGAKAEAQARLVDRAATDGPQALTAAEQLRLLADAQALVALRSRVSAGGAHAGWAAQAAIAGSPQSIAERAAQPEDSIVSAH